MAVLLYATPDDLTEGEWVDPLPERPKALIRRASQLVDDACELDRYATDADEYPTDPRVRTAFRDAVCQQVSQWVEAKINPLAGATGQAPQIASQSTEGDSVTYASLPTVADIARQVDTLCSASLSILRAAGLASRTPRML